MSEFHGRDELFHLPGGEIVTDKYGLTTGSYGFTVRAGSWHMAPNIGSRHPLAPFLLMERRRVVTGKGFWQVIGDYAGIDLSESDPEYELERGTGTEPIETHPSFVDTIGGKPSSPKNGAIFLDETGHPTSDDKLGYFDRFRIVKEDGSRNPMAGMSQYIAANNTLWVKSWTSKIQISDGGNVGKIDTPEGGAPNFGDRDWLYVGMSSRKRGGAYSHRKMWSLSGPGGHNELVYS